MGAPTPQQGAEVQIELKQCDQKEQATMTQETPLAVHILILLPQKSSTSSDASNTLLFNKTFEI
jgi:hypothetical protein